MSSTTPLSGAANIASAESVVDLVGWGSNASAFVGSAPAPGTANATSVARSASFANTADNAADFTVGAPTPTGLGTDPVDPEPEPEPQTVTIADIQGTGDVSPLLDQPVITTGVVTAHYPTGGFDGFVIQTAGTGGAIDLATHTASDAIFVYAPGQVGSVALGDTVEVSGIVGEFYNLTQIRLNSGGVVVVEDAGAPAPATVAWPTSAAERETSSRC